MMEIIKLWKEYVPFSTRGKHPWMWHQHSWSNSKAYYAYRNEKPFQMKANKILANRGPDELPIAIPSICWYMQLSKEIVSFCMNSTKTIPGKGGQFAGPRYKKSVKIFYCFIKWNIWKQTSLIKRHENLTVGIRFQFTHVIPNWNESGTEYYE